MKELLIKKHGITAVRHYLNEDYFFNYTDTGMLSEDILALFEIKEGYFAFCDKGFSCFEDNDWSEVYIIQRNDIVNALINTNYGIEILKKLIKVPNISNFWNNTSGVWDETFADPEYFNDVFLLKRGKNSSYYYSNSHIYRVSDHWGSGIGQCNWYLDSLDKCNSFSNPKEEKIGMIRFTDLEFINLND